MRRKREEHGQGLVEYALILVGIAIVVILILNIMGVSVKEAYCKVITDLGGKTCEANGECSFSFDDPSGLDTWEGNNKEQLSIEDGRACINGNGTNARSYLNPNCSSSLESNDYTITYEDITVERAIDNDKNTGLDTWFRAKDDKNGYLFIYNSRTNYVRFWKVVDGRWVKLSESKIDELIVKNSNKPSYDLLLQSKSISSALLSILTQTDLNRYNSLTITKSFLSLEYLSGTNPNIENILGVEPTSFSVEAIGRDSTIFLWYYSFDLPNISGDISSGELSKLDLMIQLDTALTDYSLKYFEQVFTENQIYGPLLIWVKNKADILQASAIISNVGDNILLRKFVLFNEADHPSPRAGFYVSILED